MRWEGLNLQLSESKSVRIPIPPHLCLIELLSFIIEAIIFAKYNWRGREESNLQLPESKSGASTNSATPLFEPLFIWVGRQVLPAILLYWVVIFSRILAFRLTTKYPSCRSDELRNTSDTKTGFCLFLITCLFRVTGSRGLQVDGTRKGTRTLTAYARGF